MKPASWGELHPGKVTYILDGRIVDGIPKEIPQGSALSKG